MARYHGIKISDASVYRTLCRHGVNRLPRNVGLRKVKFLKFIDKSRRSVKRSHRSDQEEFYQLLNYVDDQDLNKKLEVWEKFYNFSRPQGAFGGQAPYEILRERLQ